MFQLVLTVWWAGLWWQPVHAQITAYRFRVLKGNEQVGVLQVERKINGTQTVCTLTSFAEFDFLLAIRVDETITDVFENGSLHNSSHQRHINGDLKVNHTVKRNESGYRVVDQSDRVRDLDDSIRASVLSLYFEEPTHGSWVYSQNFRRMLKVYQTAPHRYGMDLPNGGTTRYTYEHGALTSVESDTYLGTVKFIKEN